MRNFTVGWDKQGSLDVLSARAFLGPVRAAALDAELEGLRVRLAATPESGAQVEIRGEYSAKIRKVPLSRTPFCVYYRVNVKTERVVLFMLRHQGRPSPKF